MEQAQFRTHYALRRIFIIALAAVLWSAVSVPAHAGDWDGWHHHHDHVAISGAPSASVTAGQAYSFAPSATDSQGRTLVFAISNRPAWASFNPATGQLAGTPATASVGSYANIVISVSDGEQSASLPAFTVQVLAATVSAPPPPPPTISGTPPTSAVAGTPYTFQPTASGPAGMSLSFSVQNKPSWANFSIASGQLTGTPSSTQTGSYSNIVVSVSDGQASSALAPFTISVAAGTTSTTGSATLNWVPPTQNTNGSALTNLAGIILYYGTAPASLTQSVQVASTTQTSYTVANLAAGTWYFASVAYTNTGVKSAMSALVSASIP
jgi:hypothetical protein